MKSQWFDLKQRAISLRLKGLSIREIEKLLAIPRSTLSGWLKDVPLTDAQKLWLKQSTDLSLIKARVKATQWHKAQKEQKLQIAKDDAVLLLRKIKINGDIVELALAMLYMGEGAKNSTTTIGNSNPLILKFFLTVILKKYRIELSDIRFVLHIRNDQDSLGIRKYWSKELGVPIESFKYVVTDKRIAGKASYSHNYGICIINCGNIAIQRKLIQIYNQFCQRVIDEWAVSSFG